MNFTFSDHWNLGIEELTQKDFVPKDHKLRTNYSAHHLIQRPSVVYLVGCKCTFWHLMSHCWCIIVLIIILVYFCVNIMSLYLWIFVFDHFVLLFVYFCLRPFYAFVCLFLCLTILCFCLFIFVFDHFVLLFVSSCVWPFCNFVCLFLCLTILYFYILISFLGICWPAHWP